MKLSSVLKKINDHPIVTVVALFLVFIILSATMLISDVYSTLDKVKKKSINTKNLSCVDVDGYVNIALLGVDARGMKKGDLKESNTDCIMVVSINTKTNEVQLLSVFRDSFMKINGTDTYEKINSAYALGGPEGALTTLNQNLDLNIQDYVSFNFKMVADLVDEVGGIEVDVKEYEIKELNRVTFETSWQIGKDSYTLVKKPGKQTLDGTQAVAYGRIRKGVGDDFKRTNRMRIVVQKVANKMKKKSVPEIMKVLDKILPEIETSLSNNNMIGLAQRLPGLKIGKSVGFPYTITTTDISGVSYVVPADLYEDVERLHKEMFKQKEYQPTDTCVSISENIKAITGTWGGGSDSTEIVKNFDKDKKKEQKRETENMQNGSQGGEISQ